MRRRAVVWAIIAVVVVALLVIYYHYDPSQGNGSWFPRCGLYTLTGLRCPGCGLQRAAHALLHGDVMAALRFNAFLPFLLVMFAVIAYGELRAKPASLIYRVVHHPVTAVVIVVLMVLWMVVRNILGI